MPNESQIHSQKGPKTLDRRAALRNIMELFWLRGFADTSIADLTKTTGMNHGALYTAFGTKGDIFHSAVEFYADAEATLAYEPLHTSSNGREAIRSMLEENVRLCRRWPNSCSCLFTLNALIMPSKDNELQDFLRERRRLIAKQVRTRLTKSVAEGELPEGANVEALANLCITVLSGLSFRVMDGVSMRLLFRSIEIFVEILGFRVNRKLPKNRRRRFARVRH